MKKTIAIKALSFQYSKSKKTLNNLSINVPKGSIYGFLGQNGSGKSTTMSLITGLLTDKTDSIKLFGEPLKDQLPSVFNKIGSLIESPAIYLHLSGYDNLKYIAKIKGVAISKIDEVLELIGLSEERNKAAKKYSLGMKQRLAIGFALLGEPELLLLDEPVNGLDPSGIIEVRNLLIKLNKEKGITIFISSHLLSEIEKMCTHIGIINHGEIIFEGTLEELSKKSKLKKIEVSINDVQKWVDLLNTTSLANSAVLLDNQTMLIEIESSRSVPDFIKELIDRGAEVNQFKALDELEDLFMEITTKA